MQLELKETAIAIELKFLATPEKGDVSALLTRPPAATHLLVMGHAASSNMRTSMMTAIAESLAEQRIATFRYNFPYSENKCGRDSKVVCTATIRAAIAAAKKDASEVMPMYELNSSMASLEPTPPELLQLFGAPRGNQSDNNQFLGMLAGTVPVTDFLAPNNTQRIVSTAG